MAVLVIYHENYSSEGYPYLKYRIKPAFQALKELINQGKVEIVEPETNDQILGLMNRIHSWQHLQDVRDSAYYQVSLLSVAGVVQAAELLTKGQYQNAFAFVGAAGHHASPSGFWGFCYFNDIAAAIVQLRDKGLQKFLILDVDPHFGDGTRNFFKKDKNVVHINFFTGKKDEFDDKFNNYDYALSYNATDQEFEAALNQALTRLFDFDLMFVVFGHDSHVSDYGGFAFTDAAYSILARKVKEYTNCRPLLWVLSGGADIGVARRVIPDIIKILAEE